MFYLLLFIVVVFWVQNWCLVTGIVFWLQHSEKLLVDSVVVCGKEIG